MLRVSLSEAIFHGVVKVEESNDVVGTHYGYLNSSVIRVTIESGCECPLKA